MKREWAEGSDTLSPHAIALLINIDGDYVDIDAGCSCAQWLYNENGDDPSELAADAISAWEAHRHIAWKAEGL